MLSYFDCFSGVAGDMILGAMLDAGLPFDHLERELKKLPLHGYKLRQNIERRGVIGGVDFWVEQNNGCGCAAGIVKGGGVGGGTQPFNDNRFESRHRSTHHATSHHHYPDIIRMINNSHLTKNVRVTACSIFEILGKAEAHVHRTTIDKVHFHEVGAVDSIVDIVGSAIGFDYFKFKEIHSSPLPITRGFVKCQHGKMPVPAPATLEIIKDVPILPSPVMAELVTPTGAAILKTVVKNFGDCPLGKISRTGYGLGDKDLKEIPNALRMMIGEGSKLIVIESNIDDMNPQIYDYLIERLMAGGAIDVIVRPVIMKKKRPAALVQVICPENLKKSLTNIILKETTTFGVRFFDVGREMLERKFETVRTKYGNVKIKLGFLDGAEIKAIPEYEDCKALAQKHKVPITEIYRQIKDCRL